MQRVVMLEREVETVTGRLQAMEEKHKVLPPRS